MKKLASAFLSVLLMLSMSACGSQNAPTQPPESQLRNEEGVSSDVNDSKASDTAGTASDSESAETTESVSDSEPSIPATSPVENPKPNPMPSVTSKPSETNKPTEPTSAPTPAVPITPPVENPKPDPEPTQRKSLIVYFSWSSNTERMANTIKDQTGGDLLELIPVTAYPIDYTACTEVALAERDNNSRLAIQNLPASIDEYDTILIGYPIWWHTAPMIIGTFLDSYDLTGVDVYPFTQSASMNREQFDNSMEFVRECAKGAAVHDGLFARYSDTNAIISYLNSNNFIK